MPSWKKVITSGSDAVLNSLNTISSLTSSGDFKLDGAFYDNNNQPGTPGQILILSSSSIIWSDNIADQARDLVISGKNMTLSTIEKGTPLYFSGSGVAGNVVGVYPADAGNPARMPAGGVAGEQLIAGAEGDVYIYGFINGVDTSAFNSGDDVFVGVGGGYTNVKPTGSALIQKLGNVEKVDAGNGSGVIQGPSWYNDLPNIQENYVWLGDSNGVPQAVASSSLLVDTASLALNVEYDNVLNKPTLISSSLQFNDLTSPFTGSFTGSFTGDGSELTGISVAEVATVAANFTSQTSVTVTHNFDSKNVIVTTYNDSDTNIIPDSITTINTNQVTVTFDTPVSGRIVVAKGGHIVSGSALTLNGESGSYYLDYNNFTNIPSGIVSSSNQITNLTTYREDLSGSNIYTIVHNLNEEFPVVQTWNTITNLQELPEAIESLTTGSLKLTFSTTFTGRVIIKK